MKRDHDLGVKPFDLFRYAAAVFAVFAATVLRFWLSWLLRDQPFPTYFVAVLLVAARAGPGPAVLATVLSGASAVYFFMEPLQAFAMSNARDFVRLLVFTAVGLAAALFTGAIKRAHQKAIDSEVKLTEARAREAADAALRAREKFISEVLDSLPHEIAVVDGTGAILAVNARWRRFAQENKGAPTSIGVGVNYLDVSRAAAEKGDGFANAALEGIQALLNRERTEFEMEYPCHAPDQERWFLMHAARADCAPAAIVISHTDITDRKRASEELRQSEQRFSSFMRHLPGLAWIKDLQGRYVFVNHATAKAFQRSPDDICGSTDCEVFDAATAAQFHANDEKALASKKGVIAVETLTHDDGATHHSLVSEFPIRDPDGVPRAVAGVAIDITERIETEAQLRAVTAKLQEADRHKDEFLATLAHELRNPLAPIHNAVHVLRRDATQGGWEPRDHALLSMIERQVQHLVRLVDDLLEVSRITRGKIKLQKRTVDLSKTLQDALDIAAPGIDEAKHELKITLPREPLLVDGDAVRLAQVFANLLNNAAKYTEQGGRISLVAERCGDEAVVTISDSGVGISEEMLPRVFDLFTQVDRASGRAQSGLGIGLALVRRLVEMHGGTVEAKSEGLKKGSTFVVRLPLAPQKSWKDSAKGREPTKGLPVAHRVLVIDDEHDVADSLAMLLEMLGAKVEVAYSGLAGLEALQRFKPDLVFLDLGMPDLDGYQTARQIRELPEGKSAKLVALTGWGQKQIQAPAREAGFDQALTKPTSFEALHDLLAE